MTTQDSYRRRPGDALVNLVEAGRDLVHGAAGSRPGSRRRRHPGGIGQVSRWVGEGINWLLEGESNAMAQGTPWAESQVPPESTMNGLRRVRPASDLSGSEASHVRPTWSEQGSDGSRRRPLQVIPHPAPPLLQQAEPSPERWAESPRHQGGGRPSRRPRPRSSRNIQP